MSLIFTLTQKDLPCTATTMCLQYQNEDSQKIQKYDNFARLLQKFDYEDHVYVSTGNQKGNVDSRSYKKRNL